MTPYITRLAWAFAFAALLAVLAAPQAPAMIPDRDPSPATSVAPSHDYSLVDSLGRTKPGYIRYGGVWVRSGSGGGAIPAPSSAPRPSRHGAGKRAPAAPSFAWGDVGLGAGTAIAALLGLGLGAAALRRTVRPTPAT